MIAKPEVIEQYFDKTVVNYGTKIYEKVVREEEEDDYLIKFKFPFKGKPEDIRAVRKGCTCTSAFYDPKENAIVGTLDLRAKLNAMGSPSNTVQANVMVDLENGKDLEVIDPNTKISTNNQEYNGRVNLRITGQVDKESVA